jgi:hypothetical protein
LFEVVLGVSQEVFNCFNGFNRCSNDHNGMLRNRGNPHHMYRVRGCIDQICRSGLYRGIENCLYMGRYNPDLQIWSMHPRTLYIWWGLPRFLNMPLWSLLHRLKPLKQLKTSCDTPKTTSNKDGEKKDQLPNNGNITKSLPMLGCFQILFLFQLIIN